MYVGHVLRANNRIHLEVSHLDNRLIHQLYSMHPLFPLTPHATTWTWCYLQATLSLSLSLSLVYRVHPICIHHPITCQCQCFLSYDGNNFLYVWIQKVTVGCWSNMKCHTKELRQSMGVPGMVYRCYLG